MLILKNKKVQHILILKDSGNFIMKKFETKLAKKLMEDVIIIPVRIMLVG